VVPLINNNCLYSPPAGFPWNRLRVTDGHTFVRTIQCFDAKTGDFAQDRPTKEHFG
jgi:hypothetical protein